MPRHIRRLFVAVVSLLLVPAFAAAATVYEVNTTGATTIGSKNNSGVFIGQSFNSGSNTLLSAASLQINNGGLGVENFTIGLYHVTGSPGVYLATGTSLASATFSNSILSGTGQAFYTFNNLNWNLSPNTVYMFGIEAANPDSVKWTLNQSATKDSSTGFITGYSGYNAQDGNTVDNGLHGATITAVPEPATFVLAAAGLLAIAALRRRR